MRLKAAPAATPPKAIGDALLRYAITFGGAWLVRNGYLDQPSADSAAGPIVYDVRGGRRGPAGRARVTHSRWVQAWLAPARSLPTEAAPPSA